MNPQLGFDDLLFEEPKKTTKTAEEKEKLLITESDLTTYLRCPHAYYLKKVRGMKSPQSGFAAQMLFFEIQRRKLFPHHLVGPELKNIETLTAGEIDMHLPYTSATFGNALLNKWLMIAKNDPLPTLKG